MSIKEQYHLPLGLLCSSSSSADQASSLLVPDQPNLTAPPRYVVLEWFLKGSCQGGGGGGLGDGGGGGGLGRYEVIKEMVMR